MRGSNLAPSFSRHFPRNFFGSCGDFCIFACRNHKIAKYEYIDHDRENCSLKSQSQLKIKVII